MKCDICHKFYRAAYIKVCSKIEKEYGEYFLCYYRSTTRVLQCLLSITDVTHCLSFSFFGTDLTVKGGASFKDDETSFLDDEQQ